MRLRRFPITVEISTGPPHSAAAQSGNRLEPTETFLHFLAALLTQPISFAWLSLFHTVASRHFLALHRPHLVGITRWRARHRSMRFDATVLKFLKEFTRIVALVHAHRLG